MVISARVPEIGGSEDGAASALKYRSNWHTEEWLLGEGG
jgi:hypothetical protein